MVTALVQALRTYSWTIGTHLLLSCCSQYAIRLQCILFRHVHSSFALAIGNDAPAAMHTESGIEAIALVHDHRASPSIYFSVLHRCRRPSGFHILSNGGRGLSNLRIECQCDRNSLVCEHCISPKSGKQEQ